jgi:glycosyltransferase involved in cell wall biosynthesis
MPSVSVLIPAYNCASTIRATLGSVFQQTVTPDEILVMNDGSSDDTEKVLESYGDRIKVFSQPNSGVARARNELVARARGEILAFLDSDDLWHPRYLEMQVKVISEHPKAIAFWVNHANFHGDGEYQWNNDSSSALQPKSVEMIDGADFFKRYNRATGPFSCLSYCCLLRSKLVELGNEPFKVSGVEDSHCCYLLSLAGPVLYTNAELVAYRVRGDSLSHDHSKTFGDWVRVFEILEDKYNRAASADLLRAFRLAFASKRRSYAKLLMGVGRPAEARSQLLKSAGNSGSPISIGKSLGLLLVTYLPKAMQPKWPSRYRG